MSVTNSYTFDRAVNYRNATIDWHVGYQKATHARRSVRSQRNLLHCYYVISVEILNNSAIPMLESFCFV